MNKYQRKLSLKLSSPKRSWSITKNESNLIYDIVFLIDSTKKFNSSVLGIRCKILFMTKICIYISDTDGNDLTKKHQKRKSYIKMIVKNQHLIKNKDLSNFVHIGKHNYSELLR